MAQIVAEDIIERNNEDNGHDQPVQVCSSNPSLVSPRRIRFRLQQALPRRWRL